MDPPAAPRPAAPPKDPWMLLFIKFLGPVALFGLLLLIAYAVHFQGSRYRLIWGYMLGLFLLPTGKFIAIPMVQYHGFDILTVTFFLGGVDLCFAIFFTLNFDLAYRIPHLGSWVHRAEAKGRIMLEKKPWIRHLAFTGIFLWAAVPFHGTGAISGAIIGRLLGLGKAKSIAAISLAGYIGIFAVGFTSVSLRFAYQAGIDWGLWSTLLITTFLYILWAGYWSPYRPRSDELRTSRGPPAGPSS